MELEVYFTTPERLYTLIIYVFFRGSSSFVDPNPLL